MYDINDELRKRLKDIDMDEVVRKRLVNRIDVDGELFKNIYPEINNPRHDVMQNPTQKLIDEHVAKLAQEIKTQLANDRKLTINILTSYQGMLLKELRDTIPSMTNKGLKRIKLILEIMHIIDDEIQYNQSD